MVWELKLDLEVLTPLFMGGAGPSAELRAPSLKGLLRFWYRAVDPRFNEPWDGHRLSREAHLFGGTARGSGQSGFLLRVESSSPVYQQWKDFRAARFSKGSGKHSRNGLVYLGYPFQMAGNENRTAIAPGHRFSVRCIVPRSTGGEQGAGDATDIRRSVVAAWWLLTHLGGAGSRARRGFGSLALLHWEPSAGDWPELKDLAVLSESSDPDAWQRGCDRGLAVLRSWFGSRDSADGKTFHHPHLGPELRYVLLNDGFHRGQWDKALADMGDQLQGFRQRRAPDYQMVKDHLLAIKHQGGKPLQATPPRASFGLPLTFRYSGGLGPVTIVPFDEDRGNTFERHGSLLFLRLVPIGEQLYPLFVRLAGDVPGESPPAALRRDNTALLGFRENAMDGFMNSLRNERR
jgi:CRISPR-associated protein Cmr1